MGWRGPGALPQVEKREQYARLIAQGYNNSEACRIVGINRRTGKRWRHGRTITTRDGRKLHYAAVVAAAAGRRVREISDRYLSEQERVRIADLRQAGHGVRAIAGQTGRSPSTISRELRRNRDPGSGQYRPFTAHKLAARRRARPRPGKIAADPVLRRFVAGRLEQRWSPQQVSQALRREFPDEPARQVVHETIYQAVYRPELGGLSRELPARVLRTRRRRRRPHRRPGERRPNGITAMTMIDQRPAGAAAREEPGHWEGDPITGASNRSAIGTLVDRASRYTILLHLPGRHTAEAVRDALIAAFCQLPPQLRRSLTWDPGKEMALHAEVTAALGMPVYFCEKASPWQRPSNENTNGLLRQYFPKGSDLRAHGPGDLAAVAAELNARPRQTLGWDTPAGRLGRRGCACPHGERAGAGMMTVMPDMRRRTPEPPAGPPQIQFKPGTANELLHQLAPLLAEEGIDVDNIDASDPDTLQQALNRAIERHNMAMFTPVGHARELAAVTMRLAAEAIAGGDTTLAAGILDQAQPESPDDSAATVAACTGLALGLLDQWLSGHDTSAPPGLAGLTRLPAGHWTGERAATDILTLARKRRAFASLDSRIARQGGRHVLYGSALALAAALQAWARHAGTPLTELARTAIR